MSTLSRTESVTSDRAISTRLPGVDGVWVAIGADSVIFAILFASFMQARLHNPAVFEASRHTLNINLGGIDTLILLTSSWSVALGIQALKRDLVDRAPRYLLGGVLTGLMFVVSKSTEYFQKFAHGLTPGTNPFYMWYFTLTGIHLFHVLAGNIVLIVLWFMARSGSFDPERPVVLECGAIYWHMVDLLWIILFPLLYLMR